MKKFTFEQAGGTYQQEGITSAIKDGKALGGGKSWTQEAADAAISALCQRPILALGLQLYHSGKGPVLFHQLRRGPRLGHRAPGQYHDLIGVLYRPHAVGDD